MAPLAATVPGSFLATAAYISIAATAISALALIALHFLNSEVHLSWHMVSEYANGRYPWVLTVVFLAWAAASWALVAALYPLWSTWLGAIGLVFLVLAGIGQAMGGIFDINHKLHGAAFAIGVPSLTVAAVLVTLALRRNGADIPMWTAHLSWISFVAMAVAIVMFMTALSRAGIDPSQTGTLAKLPEGVTAWNGWANRLLIAASYLWLLMAAREVLRAG
jgi:hypothetical protein